VANGVHDLVCTKPEARFDVVNDGRKQLGGETDTFCVGRCLVGPHTRGDRLGVAEPGSRLGRVLRIQLPDRLEGLGKMGL
jgi:hypothetical protein